MSDIEWTGPTRNPITGCSKCSEGCKHCYAITVAARGMSAQHRGLTGRATLPILDDDGQPELDEDGEPKTKLGRVDWTGEIHYVPSVLASKVPRPRDGSRRPCFVNSMSDWFHESIISNEEGCRFVAACFGWMISQPWIDFQLLTKRPEGLARWLKWLMSRSLEPDKWLGGVGNFLVDCLWWSGVPELRETARQWLELGRPVTWPPRHVLFGATVENEKRAQERLPVMRKLKAAGMIGKVFVSYEPALGPIEWEPWLDVIDQLICGGESSARARPMHTAWARGARDAVVGRRSFFFKQNGEWGPGQIYETIEELSEAMLCGLLDIIKASRGRLLLIDFTGAPVTDPEKAVFPCELKTKLGKGKSGKDLDGVRYTEHPTLVSTAFTVGNPSAYDPVLEQPRCSAIRATGQGDRGRDPEYPGGAVWKTKAEAEAWAEADGRGYEVYELRLLGSWDECTHVAEGFAPPRRLLADAEIVGRA